MTALDTEDLAVVTEEPTLFGNQGTVFFQTGDVVRVILVDSDGTVLTVRHDGLDQWVDVTSLTPLSEIQDAPDVQWGDLLDPNYVHDFVYTGDDAA